jgi:hypothetical protein
VKPTEIIYETHAAAAARHRKAAESDHLLAQVEREGPRFTSARAMLGWLFAVREHMTSIPAVDPSADNIQGLRVDKDERHWWIHSIMQALEALQRAQGETTGAMLLWLHMMPRTVVSYRVKRGIRIPVALEAVPVWDLYKHPSVAALGLSQRRAKDDFWRALTWVEDYAWTRGWIAMRARRQVRPENAVRRNG